MTKRIIRTGTIADPTGDSLKNAFTKVNDNFTELYNALGLDAETLNLGAFEFAGSTMSTTDSSAIVIDQATTITSNLTVGGDILPQTANGGDLGSSTLPWRSLYVSNNTIYIGGTAVGLDASGNLTAGGTAVGSTPAWANITGKPTIPTGFDRLTSSGDEVVLVGGANPYVTFPAITGGDQLIIQGAEVSSVLGSLALTSQDNLNIIANGSGAAPGGSKNWTFSADGSLTIPGDIRSEQEINIDINLGDSTLRRWRFGEDGDLRFPDGTVQTTAFNTDGATVTVSTSLNYTSSTYEGTEYLLENRGSISVNYSPGTQFYGFGFNFEYQKPLTPEYGIWVKGVNAPYLANESDITIDINLTDSTVRRWNFGEDGHLTLPAGGDIKDSTGTSVLGGGSSIPSVVTTGAVGVNGAAHAKVQFTVTSATTVTAVGVTAIGVTDSTKGTITLSGSPGTGAFDIAAVTNTFPGEYYILIPFATNASGTGYGAPISGEGTNPCLVRGTMITMADMSRVAVENITYSDNILVWDFDLGEFASAKPLWIKKTQTTVVSCLLTFSDHSELRIVGDSPKAHRIFNKEAGRFTYGSMPETPIGTTTFNDQGEEITLISKQWIVGEVEFYNVITDYHMNLFANSILTSMRYNNLYPITDMKFVKDGRTLRTADDYPNVEERLYKGFRLAEQTHGVEEIETHIQWLLSFEVEKETECV